MKVEVKQCTINDCVRKYYSNGHCELHYRRKRVGIPLEAPMRINYHGLSEHPYHFLWLAMMQRCHNKKNKSYSKYGGRGIKVCERWLPPNGFPKFVKDMGERPEGTSIDRINNDGDYEPSNCRWATRTVQVWNKGKHPKNTSGFIGVSYYKAFKKWRAAIGGKEYPGNASGKNGIHCDAIARNELRAEIRLKLGDLADDNFFPKDQPTAEDVADQIIALISKRLPEKKHSASGLNIMNPGMMEVVGIRNKGFNECLDLMRKELHG